MKILVLNWKDKKNPLAGGAEIITEELLKRLAKQGHRVVLLTSSFKKCKEEKEVVNGYNIIRVGNRWTVYWLAYKYYLKYLKGKFDLVIDEVNTIPFFAKFYVKENNILFIHQLCRKIWFYETFFPLNVIGYLIEPIYLRFLRDKKVITISESTRKDLLRLGFKEQNISIIPEGIEIKVLKKLPAREEIKTKKPTILFLGTIRKMKRPDQVIKAFEIAKKDINNLNLWIAGIGYGRYFNKIMQLVRRSRYRKDIVYFGKVTVEEKIRLLQRAHLLCITSVKEGWGLVVTEANSQGTPAVAYNTDGLRDAVKNKVTGLICKENTPKDLAKNIIYILNNKQEYDNLRIKAWQWSKEINFKISFQKFEEVIKSV